MKDKEDNQQMTHQQQLSSIAQYRSYFPLLLIFPFVCSGDSYNEPNNIQSTGNVQNKERCSTKYWFRQLQKQNEKSYVQIWICSNKYIYVSDLLIFTLQVTNIFFSFIAELNRDFFSTKIYFIRQELKALAVIVSCVDMKKDTSGGCGNYFPLMVM